jgi:hypothetical protein
MSSFMDFLSPQNKRKISQKHLLHRPALNKINLSSIQKGIDNHRIDTSLGWSFMKGLEHIIRQLLLEKIHDRRTRSVSTGLKNSLDLFGKDYALLLKAAILSERGVAGVQIMQLTVIKFIIRTTLKETAAIQDGLIQDILPFPKGFGSKQNRVSDLTFLATRRAWVSCNIRTLHEHAINLLFSQISLLENAMRTSQLREKFLADKHWTIRREVLLNPLLADPNGKGSHFSIALSHYVLLNEQKGNCYSFDVLSELIDNTLEYITQKQNLTIDSNHDQGISWLDSVDNIDFLFTPPSLVDTNSSMFVIPTEPDKSDLKRKKQATNILYRAFKKAKIPTHIAAAYKVAEMPGQNFRELTPYQLYQALSGETSLRITAKKLQAITRTRSSQNRDNIFSVKDIANTKREIERLSQSELKDLIVKFIRDFVRYRRDLKYWDILNNAMDQINILNDTRLLLLSSSNGLLHTFCPESLKKETEEDIRSHVILKADIRGSTTTTSEFCKRGLNPATHFGEHFFAPIQDLIRIYGAETVFIEGDAIILCFMVYHKSPEKGTATARACSLAKKILSVVEKQNENLRSKDLPELELGIGICFENAPPTFLYYGEKRIMISPAIGTADRLSSCSWDLRKKYENQKILTNVMVYQRYDKAEKAEKGITTIRYNLGGIELDVPGFNKLKKELKLSSYKIRLPGEKATSSLFYVGEYYDSEETCNQVVVRQATIIPWDNSSNNLQSAAVSNNYYEVVTTPRLLDKVNEILNRKTDK